MESNARIPKISENFLSNNFSDLSSDRCFEPTLSKHVPLFLQGLIKHSFVSFSQRLPSYPCVQLQWKSLVSITVVHVELCKHGCGEQLSISSEQFDPLWKHHYHFMCTEIIWKLFYKYTFSDVEVVWVNIHTNRDTQITIF